MIDRNGAPLRRNFVHVSDLVRAILAAIDNPRASQQLFNICMNRPLDYGEAAAHLSRTRGFKRAEIRTDFHSNWLDNSKARHLLGWEPEYDFIKLIEEAFAYQRQADEPRKVWYVG
jgi:nucleoside-diphosphate-sugar epimerase